VVFRAVFLAVLRAVFLGDFLVDFFTVFFAVFLRAAFFAMGSSFDSSAVYYTRRASSSNHIAFCAHALVGVQ
jgi:hypothetical protein